MTVVTGRRPRPRGPARRRRDGPASEACAGVPRDPACHGLPRAQATGNASGPARRTRRAPGTQRIRRIAGRSRSLSPMRRRPGPGSRRVTAGAARPARPAGSAGFRRHHSIGISMHVCSNGKPDGPASSEAHPSGKSVTTCPSPPSRIPAFLDNH